MALILDEAHILRPTDGNWTLTGGIYRPPGQTTTALSFVPYSIEINQDWLLGPSWGSSLQYRSAPPAAQPVPALPVEQREMPVIGYRAWTYEEKFDMGVGLKSRLKSTGLDYHWKKGKNVATCKTGAAHDAPDQHCQCGLYVLASLKELDSHVQMGKRVVVGAVMGWGRVVQHGTEGWRAQYAKILALLDCKYSDKQRANTDAIAARYGLEVKSRTQLSALVSEYGDPFS